MPTFNPTAPLDPPALRVLGKLNFCPADPPRACGTYVLQRVRPGLGNVTRVQNRSLQLRAHVPHNTSASAPQIALRDRFRAAVGAWQAMSQPQRAAWRALTGARNISGYNAFLSQQMRVI